jgi:hypothetical protein
MVKRKMSLAGIERLNTKKIGVRVLGRTIILFYYRVCTKSDEEPVFSGSFSVILVVWLVCIYILVRSR